MKYAMMTVLGALAACAPVGEIATARLGPAPVVSGGHYTSGGGISVAADVREDQGRTLVCGVWALGPRQSILTKLAERQVLDSGSVFVGRERVVHGLLFMRQVDPALDYGGQEAGCVRLDRPWQAGDAERPVMVRIPRQVVADESDEMAGPVVEFIQSGPGAGPRP